MSPAKNLGGGGGRGLRKILGEGSKNFMKFYSRFVKIWGKGQNYENQNIEIQKEHRKCFKASEHRKCPSEFPEK
jgi:hypothetical protein